MAFSASAPGGPGIGSISQAPQSRFSELFDRAGKILTLPITIFDKGTQLLAGASDWLKNLGVPDNSISSENSGISATDLNEMIQDVVDNYGRSAMDYTSDWNDRILKYNSDEAYKAWLRSEDSAQRARDYQLEYDATYYQRLIKSLKDAGLNPILAYSQGLGSASGVSGSSPSASSSIQSLASAKSSDTDPVALIAYAIASIISLLTAK